MQHRPAPDEIDPLTAQTLDRMVRDHPWAGDWHRVRERAQRSRRAGRRLPFLITTVAGALLVVLVMVLSVRSDTRTVADDRWTDPINGISIDVEAPFRRSLLPLAPGSHEILSLSTGPLLVGSPTDGLPVQEARAIAKQGVFITIFELEPPEDRPPLPNEVTAAIEYPDRPESFDLNALDEGRTLPIDTKALTAVNAGLRTWNIPFVDHGRRLFAFVGAGSEVTPAQLDQASRLLNSLSVSPRPVGYPVPNEIRNATSPGRVRYIGTTDGRPAYVGVTRDGSTTCVLIDGLTLSCAGREVMDERGVAAIDRDADGSWFGVVVPPSVGPVTANGVTIGDGPQPILIPGVKGDSLVIRQGDTTLVN